VLRWLINAEDSWREEEKRNLKGEILSEKSISLSGEAGSASLSCHDRTSVGGGQCWYRR
jgi:hypothetical protein